MKQFKNLTSLQLFWIITHFFVGTVYNLGHPVTPALIKYVHAPENVFGYFMALMTLAQIIGSPFWGNLSDKYGRWILSLGPIGYGVGQLLFSSTSNLIIIFFARFLSGFFAVITFTVHLAYLGDISSNENRKEVLAFATASFALGGGLAYFIGGTIGNNNYKLPFLIQFIFGIIFAITFFLITKKHKLNMELSQKKSNIIFGKNIVLPFTKYKKSLIPLSFVLLFFYISAISLYTGVIPYFLSYEFNFTSKSLGNVTGFVMLGGALLNFLLVPTLIKKISEKKIYLYFGIIGTSIGILSMSNFLTINFVVFFIILSIVMSMVETMVQVSVQNTIQTTCTREDASSLIGSNQSIKSLGYLVGSILSSLIFGLNHYFPFILSIILFVICIIIYEFYKFHHKEIL